MARPGAGVGAEDRPGLSAFRGLSESASTILRMTDGQSNVTNEELAAAMRSAAKKCAEEAEADSSRAPSNALACAQAAEALTRAVVALRAQNLV